MKKQSGFSLIELVLSLGLLSVVLTVLLKLKGLEHGRLQALLEKQDLMAYMDVLDWTLKNSNGEKLGIWYGFQDAKTRDRKFVRRDINDKTCWAEIKESDGVYSAVLYGKTSPKVRIPPIKFFILKNS